MPTTLTLASSGGHDTRLIGAALGGIALIIALISYLKLHPFLSLTIGAVAAGIASGLGLDKTVASFGTGVGATVASVGTLIALGAMFGKLLADSGGADQIVDTIVGRASRRGLPWAMALVGAIIGLPMFFEIGLVLIMPVVILVARRSGLPLYRVAIPALAGLSAMHGLVPPHPGPLVAVATLKANLGLTLALGVLIAIPTVIISGPIFSKFAARWVDLPVPELFGTSADDRRDDRPLGANSGPSHGSGGVAVAERAQVQTAIRPRFGVTLAAVLLPVILMLGKAITAIMAPKSHSHLKATLDFVGTPLIALTLAVVVGLVLLGRGSGMSRASISSSLEKSLPPIAGILLIVGAGGGLKQVLIDSGISKVIATWITGSTASALLLAWCVAALIRVATGSATVATVTASGILVPVTAGMSSSHVSLLVLAIGAGSLFLSHVNDAGFWLVKEYLGATVSQNLKTWTVMECLISVCGLGGVLALSAVI